MKNIRFVIFSLLFVSLLMPCLFAEEKIKIVALGDSITAGTPGFVPPRNFPPRGRGDAQSQYAYWVMKEHPDWEVYNEGVNGERSDQISKRFEADVLSHHPGALVIMAGINDLYQGRQVDEIKKYLMQIYEKAQEAGLRILTCSVTPYNSSSREVKERMTQLNDWIRRYSKENSFGFCDTYKAVEDPKGSGRLVSSLDGLHPDKEGYRKMGEAISACLAPLLKEPSSPENRP